MIYHYIKSHQNTRSNIHNPKYEEVHLGSALTVYRFSGIGAAVKSRLRYRSNCPKHSAMSDEFEAIGAGVEGALFAKAVEG
jgi:hypothetical protein